MSRPGFLIPLYRLVNFEIQRYHQNESNFNGAYSRNNLPKIIDGAYLTNPNEYAHIGTHCIAVCYEDDLAACFNSFGVEHFSKKIKKFIANKII